ncbi:MAG: hypothetical protein J6Q16_03045 [Clostridia bacterium]|nr:hypothetical protein [Clostridia bacterium]
MSDTKINTKLTSDELEAIKNLLREELRGELLAKPTAPDTPVRDPYLEEYVEVQLFKDGKDYRDDVFVSCNGENCLIRRGVPVRIKRKFALILEQSARQDVSAAEYAQSRRREFDAQARELGL